MEVSSNVGDNRRERKRFVAAVLGGLSIALAAFFAGTWAGSSGALTLTSSPAKAPAAPMGPNMQDSMSGKNCCEGMQEMMRNMMKDMPNMPMKPGQMPNMPMKPGQMPSTPPR
jgi:hypothetical protein